MCAAWKTGVDDPPQPAQCRQSRDVGQGGHGELAWDSGVGLYRVDSPELRRAVAADRTESKRRGTGGQEW